VKAGVGGMRGGNGENTRIERSGGKGEIVAEIHGSG